CAGLYGRTRATAAPARSARPSTTRIIRSSPYIQDSESSKSSLDCATGRGLLFSPRFDPRRQGPANRLSRSPASQLDAWCETHGAKRTASNLRRGGPARSCRIMSGGSMKFDLRRVAEFIRGAETEELLDRVTVYREGMEPAALDLMEMELDRRGISRDDIADHERLRMESAILRPDGTAVRCDFCDRPATLRRWSWHRLLGRLPIFPRMFAYCAVHAPR